MKITELELPGVQLIESKRYDDHRGYFMEVFKDTLLRKHLTGHPRFIQDNMSCSKRGVFRGMHAQKPPLAQAKFVRVVSGRIVDFAMDIDPKSSNFGKVIGVELTPDQGRALFIPAHYAHGFLSLEDETRVLYKVDASYAPEYEVAYHYTHGQLMQLLSHHIDPSELIISEKDKSAPMLIP